MVQRKVEEKLGIQVGVFKHHDHQKSLEAKPVSSHSHDGKTRGPEVKKKMMKRSRSFKLSEIGQQTLKSSSSSSSSSSSFSCPPQTKHVQKSVGGSSPNYMKSTTCFDARRELKSKPESASPGGKKALSLARSLTKTPSFKHSKVGSCTNSKRSGVNVLRATCSSTLKDSRFPSFLMLSHGGTESEGNSVVKVCPYTYCSLNGHIHHKLDSLPPLKRFLSAKRRALKTQKSFELSASCGNVTSRVDGEGEEVIDLLIEVYADTEGKTGGHEETEESFCSGTASDMDLEEGRFSGSEKNEDETDSCSEMDEDSESIFGYGSEIEDNNTVDSQELCGNQDEEVTIVNIIINGETSTDGVLEEAIIPSEVIYDDQNDQVCSASKEINEDDRMKEEDNASENIGECSEKSNDSAKVSEEESRGLEIINILIRDGSEDEDEEARNKWDRGKRETGDLDGDAAREFNPREPNYLPLETDPEGEKVELKHQTMEERKNSEDWMIDRALQQTVTKLGPARKRKVALLVEAFETVAPITKRESLHRHHHQYPLSPVFQHAIWPIQACN